MGRLLARRDGQIDDILIMYTIRLLCILCAYMIYVLCMIILNEMEKHGYNSPCTDIHNIFRNPVFFRQKTPKENFITDRILPAYGNTHTLSTATARQSTFFRPSAASGKGWRLADFQNNSIYSNIVYRYIVIHAGTLSDIDRSVIALPKLGTSAEWRNEEMKRDRLWSITSMHLGRGIVDDSSICKYLHVFVHWHIHTHFAGSAWTIVDTIWEATHEDALIFAGHGTTGVV